MFKSLARRLLRRPDTAGLFTFSDGERLRYADPAEVWDGMVLAAGKDWPDLLRTLAVKPPPAPDGVDVSEAVASLRDRQMQAARTLADAACAAFNVRPLATEGGRPVGLTRTARLALCAALVGYVAELAAAARPFGRSPGSASPRPA